MDRLPNPISEAAFDAVRRARNSNADSLCDDASTICKDLSSETAFNSLTNMISCAKTAERSATLSDCMGSMEVLVMVESINRTGVSSYALLHNSVQDLELNVGPTTVAADESANHSTVPVVTPVREPVEVATGANSRLITPASEQMLYRGPVREHPVAPNASAVQAAPSTSPLRPRQKSPQKQALLPRYISNRADTDPILIPSSLAAQVCALILAGSGHFTHNDGHELAWPDAYGLLYYSHVKDAMLWAFHATKAMVGDTNFAYTNALRDSEYLPGPETMARIPRFVVLQGLENRQNLFNVKTLANKFRLDVSTKTLRVKKHIAFATLCYLWTKTPQSLSQVSACRSTLDKYGRQLRVMGCVRFSEKVGFRKINKCSRVGGGTCIKDRESRDEIPSSIVLQA